MSSMRPLRAARQTACTRIPVDISDALDTLTACSRAESASSRRISAHANGASTGCPSMCSGFHDHVVTVPTDATSTTSEIGAPDPASNSIGGTETVPSDEREPTMRPSRRPSANWLSTGPSDRV